VQKGKWGTTSLFYVYLNSLVPVIWSPFYGPLKAKEYKFYCT